MMHTESEQRAIDIMNAMHVNTTTNKEKMREDKATRRETRYEKWKRMRKTKPGWSLWCCCFQSHQIVNDSVDTAPLTK
jgi:hypothetical protein